MSKEQQQQQIDTDTMENAYQSEQDFPTIPDSTFDEFDQYASLATPIKDSVAKFVRNAVEPLTSTKPREVTGDGLKSPAQEKKDGQVGVNLDDLIPTPQQANVDDVASTLPTIMTDEELQQQATNIGTSRFIAYDKNSKPSYMPRADSKATYKLEHITDDTSLDSAVQYMAEEFKGEINVARRDVLGDNEASLLADDLGMDKDALTELITRPDGTSASVEEIFAMRKLMQQSSNKLKHYAESMRSANSKPEDAVSFEQAFLFHKDLLSKYMGYRAEAGRSLRAYGVDMGRYGDAKSQQEMLDLAMSGYDTQKIANIIANSDDTKGVNATVNTMGNLRKFTESGMTNFIQSILSGVSTQVVNLTSGVMQLNVSYVDRLVAEGGTRLRMFVGRDTADLVQSGEAGMLRVGMFNSWRTSLKMAKKSFLTGDAYGGVGKFQTYQNPITSEYWGLDPNSFMGNMVDGYGKGTGFMVRNVMGGTDAFFKIMAEQGEYTALAYRKAYTDVNMLKDITNDEIAIELERRTLDYLRNPTVDMVRESTSHAQRMTYQDNSETALAVSNMVRVQPWLKAFIPFINTPTSIFKQNLVNRTPLAVFRPALYDTSTAEGQIARSQLLTGVMMMYGASELIDQGWVTGSEPLSLEGKKRWESEGRKANSFAIPRADGGVTYVSYNRMENFAYPIGIIADFKQMLKQKEIDWEYEDGDVGAKVTETIELLAIASMRSMEDKTFVSGFDSLIDVLSGGRSLDDSEGKLENALKRFIVPAVVPLTGIQKDVNAWFLDDNKKETKELVDKVMDNILYLNKNATNRLDYYGRELKNVQRGNPFAITYSERDMFFREADRLYTATMQDVIGNLPKRFKGVKLTSVEYHDMVKHVRNKKHDGVDFKTMILSVVKSNGYKAIASDEMKVTMLKNVISNWDNAYSNEFVNLSPELTDKLDKVTMIKNKRKGRVE